MIERCTSERGFDGVSSTEPETRNKNRTRTKASFSLELLYLARLANKKCEIAVKLSRRPDKCASDVMAAERLYNEGHSRRGLS